MRSLPKTLISITIILFIIYRIFLLEHVPFNINENIIWLQIGVISLFALYHVIVIVYILKRLYWPYKHSSLTKIMSKALWILYYKPLEVIGQALLNIKVIKEYFTQMGLNLFLLRVNNPGWITLWLMLYQYLPMLFLSMRLYVDVFIVGQILLFYNFLVILMWIYILRGLLGILYLSGEQDLHHIEKHYLKVTILDTLELIYEPKQLYSSSKLHELIKEWAHNYNLIDLLNAIHRYRAESRTLLILQLIIAILFCIGWCGYLYNLVECKFISVWIQTIDIYLLYLIYIIISIFFPPSF